MMSRTGRATAVIVLVVGIATIASSAKPAAKRPAAVDVDYVFALTAANHFLQSWTQRDVKPGLPGLSPRLIKSRGEDALRDEICGVSNPHNQAYEIGPGRRENDGRYSFPVTLYSHYTASKDPIQPFVSEVTLVRGPKEDEWLVDVTPNAAWDATHAKPSIPSHE